jgi:hypothetical protein
MWRPTHSGTIKTGLTISAACYSSGAGDRCACQRRAVELPTMRRWCHSRRSILRQLWRTATQLFPDCSASGARSALSWRPTSARLPTTATGNDPGRDADPSATTKTINTTYGASHAISTGCSTNSQFTGRNPSSTAERGSVDIARSNTSFHWSCRSGQ